VFGSSPNATPLPTEGVDANARDYPRRRDQRGDGISVQGVGNGAPKPNVRDQVATTGPGSRIGSCDVVHTLGVDTTVVRSCSENRHVDVERVDKSWGRVPRNAAKQDLRYPWPASCAGATGDAPTSTPRPNQPLPTPTSNMIMNYSWSSRIARSERPAQEADPAAQLVSAPETLGAACSSDLV
jgi:hypothetical protein